MFLALTKVADSPHKGKDFKSLVDTPIRMLT